MSSLTSFTDKNFAVVNANLMEFLETGFSC